MKITLRCLETCRMHSLHSLQDIYTDKNMTKNETLNQIARDLVKIDLILSYGNALANRKARRHQKICYQALKKMNEDDRMNDMSDKELLERLES